MFLDLFYGLREEGVPISLQEWRTFVSGFLSADTDYLTELFLPFSVIGLGLGIGLVIVGGALILTS